MRIRIRNPAWQDPGSWSGPKNSTIVYQKTDTIFGSQKIRYDMLIPDPGSVFFFNPGSRIQGSKRHRIPDPDPGFGSATLLRSKNRLFSRIFIWTWTDARASWRGTPSWSTRRTRRRSPPRRSWTRAKSSARPSPSSGPSSRDPGRPAGSVATSRDHHSLKSYDLKGQCHKIVDFRFF